MTAQPPRFITLEGGEGVGKSTQLRRLAERLSQHGIGTMLTREPGGSPGAEQIRDLLVKGEPDRWDVVSETLLVYAARKDHIARAIAPALKAGTWVLCDRFSDSTFAYQGYARGMDLSRIHEIQKAAIGDFKPDLTLVLDLPAAEGLARAQARPGNENRFENFDSAFHEGLRQGYLAIARDEPQRCAVVSAGGSEDEVAQRLWDVVARRFGL